MVKFLEEIGKEYPHVSFAIAFEIEKDLEGLEEQESLQINTTFVRRCVRIGKEIRKLRATAKRLSVHVVMEDGRQFHCRHTQILINKAIKRERSLPKHIYYGED
jgi:hypothetical protein